MSSKAHLHALDGLRGVAAAAVLIYHLVINSAPWVLPHAFLAVDFFFVLSGFVLATAYERRLASGMTAIKFFAIRVVRLYPLILMGLVIGLVAHWRIYQPSTLVLLTAAGSLLAPTPLGSSVQGFATMPLNPPSWSLGLELLINAIYAVVAQASTFRLAAIVVISAAALAAATAFYGTADIGSDWPSLFGGAPRVTFSFFAGVLIARVWSPAWRNRLSEFTLVILVVILVAVFAAPIGFKGDAALQFFAIAVAFPATVLCGAMTRVGHLRRAAEMAGDLSYPVYILQGGLVVPLRGFIAKHGLTGASEAGVVALSVVLICAQSWLALRCFDEPIRRRLNRALDRWADDRRRPLSDLKSR